MVEIETTKRLLMNYSTRQYLIDNFTETRYFPGTDSCAKCGYPAQENILGIPFCGRHVGVTRRGMERFEKEMKKMERWNRGVAKNE